MYPKYEEDFYGWAMANAQLLKEKRFNEIDIPHLIEELEDMGESLKRELMNYVSTILEHFLKLKFAFPNTLQRNEKKWKITIKEKIRKARKLIGKHPHLKSVVSQRFMEEAYEEALESVKDSNDFYKDINLELIPKDCPYTLEQCLDEEFYPE